ncbi:MAG: PEP-CTERM sorting domain-containing protein [Azoarcus sp.]
MSAASSVLGNWLTNPLNLNSNWSSSQISIPNSWTPGTEVAVIYQFDTLGATGVNASFGVDNGIFLWLDGVYLFGARGPGSVVLGEYSLSIGGLSAGTHFLQILLEDHGSVDGYNVNITADTFIPGPPPGGSVPEPASLALVGLGLLGLGFSKRRLG